MDDRPDMKLQEYESRRVGDKPYKKFVINPPRIMIEQLGWKKNDELYGEVKNGKLVITRAE